MVLGHMMIHALAYTVVVNASIFLVMVSTSPRVWGYVDYPQAVRDKVPPQTAKEKVIAGIVSIPVFLFILGFPVISTYQLKADLGAQIPFLLAFLNPLILLEVCCVVEAVVLDWILVSKITPAFVVIPGSDVGDYKDMSHHFRGHVKGGMIMVPISLIIAAVVHLT